MKKILTAIIGMMLMYVTAEAQSYNKSNKLVRRASYSYTPARSTQQVHNADVYTGNSANSKFAINYPVCQKTGGYTVCNQEDLQEQLSQAPVDEQNTSTPQNPVCNLNHNGIIVSYYDRASCVNAVDNCDK